MNKKFKIGVIVIIVLIAIYFLYIHYVGNGVSVETVKAMVSDKADTYANADEIKTILNLGASEIIDNPILLEQAKEYALATGVTIESVIVSNAVAQAKEFGYIPQ